MAATSVASDTTRVPTKLDFRPDLQWLRAVAVLLVFAYHLGLPGFSGGYVGVDVFFVLSGYLITRLLLHELARTDRIDLLGFALRRVRRLLPVSTLVLVATLLAMWGTYGSLRRAGESVVARATALFGANIGLALQETDYLTAGEESPLQHYWSLAVEEQFYLLWPTLLLVTALVAARLGRDRDRAIRGVMVLLAIGSVLLAWRWTAVNQPLAFFLLPARAWQLIAGALLAVAELRGRRPRGRRALRWTGIALLVAMSIGGTVVSFPWPLALVPVVATAALVWAGVREGDDRPGWLEDRTMVWIGDRSYALYLWHWPPLVLLGLTEEPWHSRPLLRVAVVVGVVVATVLTYRYLEEPLRRGGALRGPASGFGFLVGATVGSLVLATVVTSAPAAADPSAEPEPTSAATPSIAPEVVATPDETPTATPDPSNLVEQLGAPTTLPADLVPSLLAATSETPAIYDAGCHAPFEASEPVATATCTYGVDDADAPLVALVGDSHAAQWFEGARRAAESAGWRLVVFTKSGCSLYEVDVTNGGERPYPQCPQWRDATRDRLAELAPDVVVVTGAAAAGVRAANEPWFDGQREGITLLRAAVPDAQIVILLDTPLPDDDVPVCLDEADIAACTFTTDDAFDELQRSNAAALADAVVDTPALLCLDGSCPPVLGNVLVYRDTDHLSDAASRLLAPALVTAVASATG